MSRQDLEEYNRTLEEIERREIIKKCNPLSPEGRGNPLFWLRNYTRTEDEHAVKKGVEPFKPFPDKRYMDVVARILLDNDRVLIPKSRETMTSWLCVGLLTACSQFNPAFLSVIQTQSENKVKKLIRYATVLYEQQPEWLRERFPLTAESRQSLTSIGWKNGGQIIAIPSGEHQIRLYHPSAYLMDECSFWSDFVQCWGAADPVAGKIWAVSSAAPGPFGDLCERPVETEGE